VSFLASRVGIDTAGGLILPTGQQLTVRIQGLPWAVVPAQIADHGSGSHNSAQIVAGSPLVRVGGQPVVRAGLPATCGHVATGSGHVSVGA
jgi:uncharacterized Zn-binding protein involved in type VI secretion